MLDPLRTGTISADSVLGDGQGRSGLPPSYLFPILNRKSVIAHTDQRYEKPGVRGRGGGSEGDGGIDDIMSETRVAVQAKQPEISFGSGGNMKVGNTVWSTLEP